jgi:hypothetical protein
MVRTVSYKKEEREAMIIVNYKYVTKGEVKHGDFTKNTFLAAIGELSKINWKPEVKIIEAHIQDGKPDVTATI